ncbi:MAG: hypothetical protein P1U40_01815 [Coxiellaceae bacterium]|nr:hypothetical protein [Coxiellaceae bacterium]
MKIVPQLILLALCVCYPTVFASHLVMGRLHPRDHEITVYRSDCIPKNNTRLNYRFLVTLSTNKPGTQYRLNNHVYRFGHDTVRNMIPVNFDWNKTFKKHMILIKNAGPGYLSYAGRCICIQSKSTARCPRHDALTHDLRFELDRHIDHA